MPRRSPYVSVAAVVLLLVVGSAGCESTPTTNEPVDPTAVTVTAPSNEVEVGATLQLTAVVQPGEAPRSVTWSSSDEARATVSGSGLVTGIAPGPATITATSTADPSVSGSLALTVTGCATLASSDVSSGATLPANTCYEVHSALSVTDGTLVVEEGVEIGFAPNGSLRMGSGGSLNAVGTATAPIIFTSLDPAGQWRGIHFDGSRSAENVLDHVLIENGGSEGWSGAAFSTSAVLLEDALVEIRNSTITGSGGQGITVYGGSEMIFEDNVLVDNEVAAWVHPDAAGFIGTNTVFQDNAENVVRVAFNNTNAVTTAQTWQTLDVPFEIQKRFYVDAALTIAGARSPCEEGRVRGTTFAFCIRPTLTFTADASMIVRDAGSVTAVGNEDERIGFGSVEPGVTKWKGLQIASQSQNVFEYVVFDDGGSQPWSGGSDSRTMVNMQGNSKAVFNNVHFWRSADYGIRVPAGADVTGWDQVSFWDNQRPMIIHPNRLGSLGETSANRYRSGLGWEIDPIRVGFNNTNAVTTPQTWGGFRLRIRLMHRTLVDADLTIKGVGFEFGTVEFAQDASLVVRDGSLRAGTGPENGTFHFIGVEDLPGYWKGISFQTASVDNKLEHVTIRNAGSDAWFGGGNGTASVHISPDGFAKLLDVTFEKSSGYAITMRSGGAIECTDVTLNGFMIWHSATQEALAACP